MEYRRHRALLIGNSIFPRDEALRSLKGPENDVPRLAEALADSQCGLFALGDIRQLVDQEKIEIAEEMERFFSEANRHEVVLLYYSGHGLDTVRGDLLLCARDSRTDRRLATAISVHDIVRMIENCAAPTVIVILDCCLSGRFKGDHFADPLGGAGRYVLTSSSPSERAIDAAIEGGLSPFTDLLIRGLRNAPNNHNRNFLSIMDLYRYLYENRRFDDPIPYRRFDGMGDIAIARRTSLLAAMDGPRIHLSDRFIDLGVVSVGERPARQRIDVHGAVGAWSAWTLAHWVVVESYTNHALLDFRTDAPGLHQASVFFRDPDLGEVTTLALHMEVRPPQAPTSSAVHTPPIEATSPITQPQPEKSGFDWRNIVHEGSSERDKLESVTANAEAIDTPEPVRVAQAKPWRRATTLNVVSRIFIGLALFGLMAYFLPISGRNDTVQYVSGDTPRIGSHDTSYPPGWWQEWDLTRDRPIAVTFRSDSGKTSQPAIFAFKLVVPQTECAVEIAWEVKFAAAQSRSGILYGQHAYAPYDIDIPGSDRNKDIQLTATRTDTGSCAAELHVRITLNGKVRTLWEIIAGS